MIKLYKYLSQQQKEYVLSKQLLRSGTAIGANVEEAIGAQSPRDFISKLAIAYKEARETHYWLSIVKGHRLFNARPSNAINTRLRRTSAHYW